MTDVSDKPTYPIPAELPGIIEGAVKQAIQQACELGERLSEQRIVEWLHEQADKYKAQMDLRGAEALRQQADAIERGEHRG